ncbi:MAG: alkylmercury lyase family protein [Actinomycetota bacterium]|nr:alkylmercury lyase family protein [Actinomycetota bacterium]
MDAADLELRNRTYARFVELGRAPAASELGAELQVKEGWRRLHDAHAVVLDTTTDELRMANPFSAVPTSYRVHARDRWWYANCAWDAFGILAALDEDGVIESSCPDCGEPVEVEVVDASPTPDDLLFHCLVPAERWWADIVFT